MNKKWRIRAATFADENQILEIIAPLKSAWFNWSVDAFLSEFQQVRTLILEDDRQILGFVSLRDVVSAWEISVLGTRKEFQSRGVMKCLFAEILNTHGQERELWLEVHENNLAARNLYRKLGFTEGHKRPLYYSDGGAAILFTKPQGSVLP